MKKSFEVKINPKALNYAIDSSGYTPKRLVERISTKRVSYDFLKSVLSGRRRLLYTDLKKIDRYLKRGIPFYLLKKFPGDHTLVNFRKKNTSYSLSPEVESKIRDYDLLREEIKLLEKEESGKENPNLHFGIETPVREVANKLREEFGIVEIPRPYIESSEFFEYLRSFIESYHLYVFKDSFPENTIRGLNLAGNGLPSLILINSNDDKNAEIFSLLHEFGHYLLKEEDIDIDEKELMYNPKVEEWCNNFAYFFMVSEEDELREGFSKSNKENLVSQKNLKELSKKYKISKHAFMYRFYKLRIISLEEYNHFRESFPYKVSKKNTKGGGGNYYYIIRTRLSKKFVRLVYSNYSEGNLSLSSTLNYFKIKKPDYINFLAIGASQ